MAGDADGVVVDDRGDVVVGDIGDEIEDRYHIERSVDDRFQRAVGLNRARALHLAQQFDDRVAAVVGGDDDVAVAREGCCVEVRLRADAAFAVGKHDQRIGVVIVVTSRRIARSDGRQLAERIGGEVGLQVGGQGVVEADDVAGVGAAGLDGGVPDLQRQAARVALVVEPEVIEQHGGAHADGIGAGHAGVGGVVGVGGSEWQGLTPARLIGAVGGIGRAGARDDKDQRRSEHGGRQAHAAG